MKRERERSPKSGIARVKFNKVSHETGVAGPSCGEVVNLSEFQYPHWHKKEIQIRTFI